MDFSMDKRYYELEKQLQAITKESQQVKPLEKLTEHTKYIPKPISYMSPDELNLRDIRLEEQLEKIARNTIKDIPGFKPTRVKSVVTDEMIKQYQRDLENQKYTDPLSGNVYKYNPGNLDTDLEVPRLLISRPQRVLNIASKENLANEIARLENDIVQLEDSKVRVTLDLKDESIAKDDQERRNIIDANEQKTLEYQNRIRNIDKDIQQAKDMINQRERAIGLIDARLAGQVNTSSFNQKELDRVAQINKSKLTAKAEELNLLNRGRLNLQQQPNESNEEFRKRLIETGQAGFDEKAVQDQAEFRNLVKFKENLKTIISNPSFIDSFIKYITTDFGYDTIYVYNKYFKLLETKYKEVFGDVEVDDTEKDWEGLKDFFDATISKTQEGKLISIANKDKLPDKLPNLDEGIISASATPIITEAKKVRERGTETEKARMDRALSKLEQKYDLNFTRGSPKGIEPSSKSQVDLLRIYEDDYAETYKELTEEQKQFIQELRELKPKFPKNLIIGLLMEVGLINKKFKNQSRLSPLLEGEGIKPKYANNRTNKSLVEFGEIKIDQKLLHNRNKLAIYNKTGTNKTGLPAIPISDYLVDIFFKILEKKPVTHLDIKQLSPKEKDTYNYVIDLAGFRRDLVNDIEQTRQNMKDRLELLEGEIEAGNTNPEIYKELHGLLLKMVYGGLVGMSKARNHYLSLGGKLSSVGRKAKKAKT